MSDMLALAAALDRLTDAIVGNGATLGAAAAQPAKAPKATKGSATTASDASADQPAPSPAPSPEPEVVDRSADVKKLVLEIAKTNREGIVALMAEFGGATKAGEIPLADHEAFIARAEELKAEADLG